MVSLTSVFKEIASCILPDRLLDLLLIFLLVKEVVFEVWVGRCWTRVVKVIVVEGKVIVGIIIDASVRRNIRFLQQSACRLDRRERRG